MNYLKLFFLFLTFIFNKNLIFSQTLTLSYHLGQTVKNNPIFPPLLAPAQGLAVKYSPARSFRSQWARLYPRTRLTFEASSQFLGNAAVLGWAWGGLAGLDFPLYQQKKHSFNTRLYLGLAVLSRHYDSFRNPQNVVIGSALNAFGKIEAAYSYQIKPFLGLNLGLAVLHYSNAGVQSPNLGINIIALSAGISYNFNLVKVNYFDSLNIKPKISYNKKYRPFIQTNLGLTSVASRGAKFPIYTLFVGASKQFSPKGCVSAGLEWVYNTATFELYSHIAGQNLPKSQFYRYSFMAQYEFIFARLALVAGGGIYLNRHVAQRSIFSSKIGLNFYPRSLWKTAPFHSWIGIQVRAYFGEAEFAELVAGFRF